MSVWVIDWQMVWANLALMGVAYVLAMPVAWNRERNARSAGLRTYPLVALATCGFMLVGIQAFDGSDAEARALQGVITGMGFIGGGAILKGEKSVTGMATAASLWSTGAIGIAVAWRRFEIALVLAILIFLTLQLGARVKPMVNGDDGEDKNHQ